MESNKKEVTVGDILKWTEKKSIKKIIEALGDEKDKVRIVAAEALGKLGDKLAIEPLFEALEMKNQKSK